MNVMGVQDILTAITDVADIAVASDAVIYTKSFKIGFAEYFSLWYQATSAGTVELKIELQESWVEPTTEGAADDNWIEPDTMADIESALGDQNLHAKSLTPIPAKYARFKITGGATNAATTTIRMRVQQQEPM